MRKSVSILFFSLIPCIFIMAVALNKIRFRYGWSDAIWRTVMTPMTGTLWAPGFSEAKFAEVKIGMSSVEVTALLGAPLQKWCAQDGGLDCEWLYSWQDTPTADFDRRWVLFDQFGRVERLRHDFFID